MALRHIRTLPAGHFNGRQDSYQQQVVVVADRTIWTRLTIRMPVDAEQSSQFKSATIAKQWPLCFQSNHKEWSSSLIDLHLVSLGRDFRWFGQGYSQDAVLELGIDLARIHIERQ